MISVTKSTPLRPELALGSPEELEQLRSEFERKNYVRLPGFLDRELYDQFVPAIGSAEFYERHHGSIGLESCMKVNATLASLLFLVNDERLFEAIRAITGCGPIGCFDGRVYRINPSSDHYDSWHSDAGADRMVAMSLNLSPEAYTGGVLQIRDVRSPEVIHEAPNVGRGDAVIFRVGDDQLQHQITPVTGSVSKTAFAGWFKSRPSFHSVIRGGGWFASA